MNQCNTRYIFFYINTFLILWFLFALPALSLTPSTSGLLLLALITSWFIFKEKPLIPSHQYIWIFALLVYGGFHVLYIAFESRGDMGRYDRAMRFIAMALVMLYLLKYQFSGKFFSIAVLLGTFLGAYFGFYEVLVDNKPRAGVGRNPISYGYLMTAMSLLSFFHAFTEKNNWFRGLMLLSGLVGVFGAFTSGTRGIVVIFGFAIILALIFLVTTKRMPKKWVFSAMVGLIAAVIVGYQFMPQVSRAINQTQHEVQRIQAGDLRGSFGQRIQMWHVASHLGTTHPLLGVGHDRERIQALSDPFIEQHGYQPHIVRIYSHFHNEYLDAFAKRGTIGLIIFVGLLVAACVGLKTHYRYAVYLIVSVIAIGGLTEGVMSSGRLLYLLMLGVSIYRCLDYFEYQRAQQESG